MMTSPPTLERPRRAAPTCSLSSHRGKSRSSRRLSVSWMLTRMVSCPPTTSRTPSPPWASPSLMVRPRACSPRLPDQSTSRRWSCFSQRRWPEVSAPSPQGHNSITIGTCDRGCEKVAYSLRLINCPLPGADDDDTILKAFDAFEVGGKIDADM